MQCDSWTPLYNIRGREANPSHSPYTLPSSVSRKSCICHSCENTGGVWVFFPFWKSLRDHSDENSLFYSSTFVSHSCALFCMRKNSTLLFSTVSALFGPTHRWLGVSHR